MKNLVLLITSIMFFGCLGNGRSETNKDNIIVSSDKDLIKEDSLEEKCNVVQEFIGVVKKSKVEVANLIDYPLKREYPIPPIKNKQELLERYDEVFDDKLINMIVDSKPVEDWRAVGWRGIMLNQGVLWLDYDGNLVAVNYESDLEQNIKNKLIEIDRLRLYKSIQNFKKPILIMETEQYRIRIDELEDYNFRYTSWLIDRSMSDKPDLIIENGKEIIEGTMRNTYYEFKNNDYTYTCYIDCGRDNELEIKKNDKVILSELIELKNPIDIKD